MTPCARLAAVAFLATVTTVTTAPPAGAAASGSRQAQNQPAEVIAELRVHGNHATGDAEIIALAGVAIGDPFTAATLEAVAERLRRSGRFDDVEVLKRYASIADPSQVALVIIVNEGPVRLEWPDEDDPDAEPKVVRRGFGGNLMWLPILRFEDGYGVTFGARLAFAGMGSDLSRLSFPLTWGGGREAGAEFSRTFTRGPVSRVEVGGGIHQEKNPAYEIRDTRQRGWGRVESVAGPLQAGGSAGWQRVDFGDVHDDMATVGADVTFDTRLNPALPRNAVVARAAWERFDISSGDVLHQVRLEGEGFLGLWGQNVLSVRARRDHFNQAAPPYLRSLLGGWSSLRGFRAGSFTGDTVVTGSTELLVPLSSPLSVGQLGVSIFADTGTAYDTGERLADQKWELGYGGSVWLTFTAFRLGLAVAHGHGASTRVHFGGGFAF